MNEREKKIESMSESVVSGFEALKETLNNPEKMNAIMEGIRADHKRKDQCPKHMFVGGKVEKFGQKFECQNCLGMFDLTQIGMYIRGYVAAGRPANEIWPGWNG